MASYSFNKDFARGFTLNPDEDGGLILDAFGSIHTVGNATNLGDVYFGWDIARDLLYTSTGKGYYILDGYGGLFAFGDAFFPGGRPDCVQDISQHGV